MAGNQAAKQTTTASSSDLVEEMDEIKQQLKQLSGSLVRIKPVITEIKTTYTIITRQLMATATLKEVRRILT